MYMTPSPLCVLLTLCCDDVHSSGGGGKVLLGRGLGHDGGEEMVLGAGAGAEWSGVVTGCIVCSCGGSARKSDSSVIGDAVGVGLGGGGERAGGGVRRGGGT